MLQIFKIFLFIKSDISPQSKSVNGLISYYCIYYNFTTGIQISLLYVSDIQSPSL